MAWGADWEAAIRALMGTQQPCLIRDAVYTVQSYAYLGYVKGASHPFPSGLPSPPASIP
jgi:hypothetical protein